MKTQIYLASQSPRRACLLEQLGLQFEKVDVSVDEQRLVGESPQAYVQRVAMDKAIKAYRDKGNPSIPVLGADTCIVLDNEVIGKPTDRAHGINILQRLSGRCHQVLTAVAVVLTTNKDPSGNADDKLQVQWSRDGAMVAAQALSDSEVEFRRLSDNEITTYWETGEPADKAGAYAIQGQAALFIRCIHGSYSGIMGLPLYETGELLRLFGVVIPNGGKV